MSKYVRTFDNVLLNRSLVSTRILSNRFYEDNTFFMFEVVVLTVSFLKLVKLSESVQQLWPATTTVKNESSDVWLYVTMSS